METTKRSPLEDRLLMRSPKKPRLTVIAIALRRYIVDAIACLWGTETHRTN